MTDLDHTRLIVATLAIAAGCGDNVKLAANDAGTDAPRTIGDVTVTTYAHCCDVAVGTLLGGVSVVSIQPDGSDGPSGITDDSGTLVLHGVRAGATVSVRYPEDTQMLTYASTYTAVEPGDHLTLGDGYRGPPVAKNPIVVTVMFPPLDHGLFPLIEAVTPCGTVTTTNADSGQMSATFDPACLGATGPVVAIAHDPGLHVVASAFVPDAPLATGTITIPAWTPNLPGNVTTSITDLGSDLSQVGLETIAVYPGPLTVSDVLPPGTPPGPILSTPASMPAAADRIVGHATLTNNGNYGEHDGFRAVAGGAKAVAMATPVVPWVSFLIADGTVGKATWVQTSGSYDGADLIESWATGDANGFHSVVWSVFLPPGVTSYDADPRLVTPSSSGFSAEVQLVDFAEVDGYADLRRLPEWMVSEAANAVVYGDVAGADIAVNSFSRVR